MEEVERTGEGMEEMKGGSSYKQKEGDKSLELRERKQGSVREMRLQASERRNGRFGGSWQGICL